MLSETKLHIHRANRTIRSIRRFFEDKAYYARGNLFLDKVVLGLVSKGLTVAQSVICLVQAGFPEEAFGLSRTLVEIALNLRFITNRSSERRAKRFVDYYAKVKMEWIRRMVKHYGRKKSKL